MHRQIRRFTTFLSLIITIFAVSACGAAEPTPDITAEPQPIATQPQVEDDAPQWAEFEGVQLPADRGDYFNVSGNCQACHSGITDASGNDVSMAAMWRGSMMGNAAKDPYWQATVRAEITENAALREIIEDKCSTCHMPMARTTAYTEGGSGTILDDGFTNPEHPLHNLAMDGVSCTVCHQIIADNFGEVDSFSGHYEIDFEQPAGARAAFGPFPAKPGMVNIMQPASGFVMETSDHIRESELCATCHTLYTPYVDAAGEILGEFAEQMPYQEWLNSSYADSQSCQGCHMPQLAGELALSSVSPQFTYTGVRQHSFAGGNNYALNILRAKGGERGLNASSADLDGAIDRMETQMQNATAILEVISAGVADGSLTFDVKTTSLVGHKFPSGFPSRRVWLHVTVTDAAGTIVFESGAYENDGSIAGNANDEDAMAFEPHYVTITQADEVQIYEAIMFNSDGENTTTLLRAASYGKDNRLLPMGFDVAGAGADIAVYGQAADDENFTGGSDTVTYIVPVGGADGALTVTVELLYQSIGFRWADNISSYDAPENSLFASYMAEVNNLPVVVVTQSMNIGE